MSGRSRAYLDTWFGDLSVGLCAEHGCFYRHPPTFDATLIEALMLESDRSINSTSPISSPIHGSFLTMSFSNPSVADMIAPRPLKNQTSITASSLLQSAVPYSPMTRHISPFRMPPQQPASPNPSLGAASSSGGGGGSKPVLRRMQHGWFALVDQVDSSWCDEIRPLFEYYTERTPGSLMEEKEVNMTWNYRNSDPEFGMWQAAELHVNLEQIVNHLALSVSFSLKFIWC
ncbi:trehalose-phosphatase-domain-containing protein [Chytriomyces sp. MP71]|nr:trehalose-phosphatase-domain-containing protein [Chytriomyces sp. MP71]